MVVYYLSLYFRRILLGYIKRELYFTARLDNPNENILTKKEDMTIYTKDSGSIPRNACVACET